jgi:mycofactocin system creatininase family protein
MSLLLAEQSWTDLVGRKPLVVLPLGSCEQHGPHLPLETDMAIAATVARNAVPELARVTDVLLAPQQDYAASGEHEGFPGTVSIGCEALHLLLIELGRSVMRWCGRLLIVNGHGGNHPTLISAITQLRAENRDVAWWACGVPGGDAHAGRSETGIMMALDPRTVRAERATAGRTEPIAKLMRALESRSVRQISPNGVLGDPAGASAAEGERAVREMTDQLCAAARTWHVDDAGRLAPWSSRAA